MILILAEPILIKSKSMTISTEILLCVEKSGHFKRLIRDKFISNAISGIIEMLYIRMSFLLR